HLSGDFMQIRFRSPLLKRLALFAAAALFAAQAQAQSAPRVFVLDAETLQTNKRLLGEGDKTLAAALVQLKREADDALAMQPLTVMDKAFTPPSGDKHDYMSQVPYFWADSSKPDGLPYLRKDGERNPEIRKFRNHDAFNKLMATTEVLSLAWYFTG